MSRTWLRRTFLEQNHFTAGLSKSVPQESTEFFVPEELEASTDFSVQRLRQHPEIAPSDAGMFGLRAGGEICYVDWCPSIRGAIETVLSAEEADSLFQRSSAQLSSDLSRRWLDRTINPHQFLNDGRLCWYVTATRLTREDSKKLPRASLAARRAFESSRDVAKRGISWLSVLVYYVAVAAVAAGFLYGGYWLMTSSETASPAQTIDSGETPSDSPVDPEEPDIPYGGFSSYSYTGCDSTVDEYGDEVWGDGFQDEEECLQDEWDNREGEAWTTYSESFVSASDEGCASVFELTADGMLYSDDYEFSSADCGNIDPGLPEDVAPSMLPDFPEDEGAAFGFEAGCAAIFDWMEYDEVYWGDYSFTVDDCYSQNPY